MVDLTPNPTNKDLLRALRYINPMTLAEGVGVEVSLDCRKSILRVTEEANQKLQARWGVGGLSRGSPPPEKHVAHRPQVCYSQGVGAQTMLTPPFISWEAFIQTPSCLIHSPCRLHTGAASFVQMFDRSYGTHALKLSQVLCLITLSVSLYTVLFPKTYRRLPFKSAVGM